MLFHCRTQYSALFSTSLSIHINVASIWKIRYFHRRNFWEFRAPILKLEHSHRFDLLKVISVHFSQSSSPGYFAYIPPVLNKFTATRWCRSAKPERSIRFALLARRRSDWSVVIFVCIVLSDCHTLRPFIVLRWMPGTRRFWYAVQSVLSYVGSGSVIWNCSTLFTARKIYSPRQQWHVCRLDRPSMSGVATRHSVSERCFASPNKSVLSLVPRPPAPELQQSSCMSLLLSASIINSSGPWSTKQSTHELSFRVTVITDRQTDKRHWKQ